MNFLNLDTICLRSREFLASKPRQQVAWLKLMAYCTNEENGGIIRNARAWIGREWREIIGVNSLDVHTQCALWSWNDKDLHVSFYNLKWEARHLASRHGADATNRKRWGERVGERIASDTNSESVSESVGDSPGKVREEKVNKGKVREEPSLPQEPVIPTEAEVRDWAAGPVGVDPDYAAARWAATGEKHGWIAHGRLIDWRRMFFRFWTEDREGVLRKKIGAPLFAPAAPGDEPRWWSMPLEELDGLVTGALLVSHPHAQRLKAIWNFRKNQSKPNQ